MFDGTKRRRHTDYSFDEGEFVVFTGELEVDPGGGVVLVIVVVGDYDGRSFVFKFDGNWFVVQVIYTAILC